MRAGAHPPGELVALEHLLHDMRLYKSAAEVKVMARAGKISAEAVPGHEAAARVAMSTTWKPS